MDELLYWLIENEREAEEAFENIPDAELAPVAVIDDVDGERIEIYGDGSYLTRGADGEIR